MRRNANKNKAQNNNNDKKYQIIKSSNTLMKQAK